MSEEEKIRRAEIIAERRNNRIPANSINSKDKKRITSLGKIALQILVSICIFGVCYFLYQNNSNAIEMIKPVISADTNFQKIYYGINEIVKNVKSENTKSERSDEASSNENETDQNKEENSKESEVINNKSIPKDGNNINDITFIKNNVSFIKPLQGKVTSKFGEREPTDVISANHKGVDIGAEQGTYIIASMEGKAETISEEGEYGKHIIIKNGEVSTLYAHCSEILIKEGEQIEQGKAIAKVGETGKATGPHLHFEIRRNDVAVNPEEIIELE